MACKQCPQLAQRWSRWLNFFTTAPLQFTGIPLDSTRVLETMISLLWFGFLKNFFFNTSKSHIPNTRFYLNKGKCTHKWKLVFLFWASTLQKRDSLPRNFCKTVLQYFFYLNRSPDRGKYRCKISVKLTDFWSRLASGNSYRFPDSSLPAQKSYVWC